MIMHTDLIHCRFDSVRACSMLTAWMESNSQACSKLCHAVPCVGAPHAHHHLCLHAVDGLTNMTCKYDIKGSFPDAPVLRKIGTKKEFQVCESNV